MQETERRATKDVECFLQTMFGKQVPVAPPRHPFADYFDPVQVVKRVILSTLSSISAGWDPAPDLAGLPLPESPESTINHRKQIAMFVHQCIREVAILH